MSDLESIDENAVSLLAGTGPAHKIVKGPWEGFAPCLEDFRSNTLTPLGYFLRDGYVFVLDKGRGANRVLVSKDALEDGLVGLGRPESVFAFGDDFMNLLLCLCPNLMPGVERPQWHGTAKGCEPWKL